MKNKGPNKQNSEYAKRLNSLFQYIKKNISENISTESAAKAAGLSPFHYHRIIKSITGESLWGYIMRQRVEIAANLLVSAKHKMSLTQIALECGFSSSSTFSRAFKEHFKISPSKWKKSRICKESFSKIEYISNTMTFKVAVNKLLKRLVAYTSTIEGYTTESIEKSFMELFVWASQRRLVTSESRFIGMGIDNPDISPVDKCRYFNCIEVPGVMYNSHTEMSFMKIPEGKYAIIAFNDKKEYLMDAYDYIYREWLPKSKYIPGDSWPYEHYKSPPTDILHLDLCIPIQ